MHTRRPSASHNRTQRNHAGGGEEERGHYVHPDACPCAPHVSCQLARGTNALTGAYTYHTPFSHEQEKPHRCGNEERPVHLDRYPEHAAAADRAGRDLPHGHDGEGTVTAPPRWADLGPLATLNRPSHPHVNC